MYICILWSLLTEDEALISGNLKLLNCGDSKCWLTCSSKGLKFRIESTFLKLWQNHGGEIIDTLMGGGGCQDHKKILGKCHCICSISYFHYPATKSPFSPLSLPDNIQQPEFYESDRPTRQCLGNLRTLKCMIENRMPLAYQISLEASWYVALNTGKLIIDLLCCFLGNWSIINSSTFLNFEIPERKFSHSHVVKVFTILNRFSRKVELFECAPVT